MKNLQLILFLLLCACSNSQNEKYISSNNAFQPNVDICIQTMLKNGIDSARAKEYCPSIINYLYSVDSTIFSMEPKSLDSLMNIHEPELKILIDSINNRK